MVIPRFTDVLCMVGIALCSFCAQLLISRGFQLSRAAPASAVNYLQVILGSVWGFLFFDESIGMVSVLGVILIFGGVLLISSERPASGGGRDGGDDEELLLLPTQSAVRVERAPTLPAKLAAPLTR